MGLGAVLDRESQKDDSALSQLRGYHGRSAGEVGFAYQPAAFEQLAIGVADYRFVVLGILRGDVPYELVVAARFAELWRA